MIVLDTDVLTILQYGSGSDFDRLAQRLASFSDPEPALTILSFEEQARGWLAQISRARQPAELVPAYRRFRALLDDYSRWTVLDFSDAAAKVYTDLRRTYRRHGSIDLRIAAIAIENNAVLISGNARDFGSIAGLRFEGF